MTRKELFLIAVLGCVQFSHIVDFMIMMPLGPQLMRVFGVNTQEFGLLVSSYTVSAAIAGLAGVFFLDMFDRKRALYVSFLGFALGTIACGFAPSYALLLAARCLTGLFGGITGSLIFSIVGDVIPAEKRGRAMGSLMASFSVASVVGVPFGLLLANKFDWHAPFFFLGTLSLVTSFLILFFVPSVRGHLLSKGERKHPAASFLAILKNRNAMLALGMMVLILFGQFGVIPFLSQYMVGNVGFTEIQLPYIYIVGGIVSIISNPLIGRMSDKMGKQFVFTVFAIAVAVPLFLVTNLPKVPIWQALVVAAMFFICSGGRMVPATAMSTSTVPPQNRGSFMSLSSFVQNLFSGVSSYVGGLIVTKAPTGELHHFPVVGYIAIACSLASVLVARQLRLNDSPRRQFMDGSSLQPAEAIVAKAEKGS